MKVKFKLDVSSQLEKKISETLKENVDSIIESAIDKTIEDLKERTPKDTGYAASRWRTYKQNSFKVSFSFKNDFIIKFTETNDIIENDADYISYLNAGWSKQAPSYFIEQTVLQNGFIPSIK